MASVFEAKNYREFICNELDSERFGRGYRAKLAEHLNVQVSFVSLVLTGRQDFTLEQAIRISEFLNLTKDEIHFLLLMVNRDRAGNVILKKYYDDQLKEIKSKRSEVQNQIKALNEITESDAFEYYSAWYHSAVHMCARNPKLNRADLIAQELKIKTEQIKHSLQLLEKIGFLKIKGDHWEMTEARFHLGKFANALRVHHMNWRNQAIRSIDEGAKENVHYSAIYSIDLETFQILKKRILNLIRDLEPEIINAKDEKAVAFCLDWFLI